MSERVCGNCAWWDEMESHPGVGQCRYVVPTRVDDEAPWPLTGPNDWCRHHATTRGWDHAPEQREKPATSEQAQILKQRSEIGRLRARCREARRLLEDAVPVFKEQSESHAEWEVDHKHWMEASDDE